jgi:hypothetical protein
MAALGTENCDSDQGLFQNRFPHIKKAGTAPKTKLEQGEAGIHGNIKKLIPASA